MIDRRKNDYIEENIMLKNIKTDWNLPVKVHAASTNIEQVKIISIMMTNFFFQNLGITSKYES